MHLRNLSLLQLKFAQVGMNADVNAWQQAEQQLPLQDQINCVLALAHEPEPKPIIQRLIVAKRLSNRHKLARQ